MHHNNSSNNKYVIPCNVSDVWFGIEKTLEGVFKRVCTVNLCLHSTAELNQSCVLFPPLVFIVANPDATDNVFCLKVYITVLSAKRKWWTAYSTQLYSARKKDSFYIPNLHKPSAISKSNHFFPWKCKLWTFLITVSVRINTKEGRNHRAEVGYTDETEGRSEDHDCGINMYCVVTRSCSSYRYFFEQFV